MPTVKDTGRFCNNCRFFESDDGGVEYFDDHNNVLCCVSCGCPKDSHINAKVVTIDA